MSAIDEFLREIVYAPDGGIRQSFSLDRDNAVALLREFSLAEPHFYILELVQAAIANGAESVEIVLYRYGAQVDLKVYWEGRNFTRMELTNLLDYLFEDQQDFEQADTMLLARGVNGLLLFEPQLFRIFSPGYKDQGPVEVEIDRLTGMATLREPDPRFLGRNTMVICADDLRGMPEYLRFARGRYQQWPEHKAISSRLVSSKPVIFNERPVEPKIRTSMPQAPLSIEEEDLKGLLWSDPEEEWFYFATHGVAVDRAPNQDSEKAGWRGAGNLTGLTGFIQSNQFVKTVDQYGLVREAHYDHVMARILPYLRGAREEKSLQSGTPRRVRHQFQWAQSTEGDTCSRHEVSPEELLREIKKGTPLVALRTEDLKKREHWAPFTADVNGKALVVTDEELPNLRALAGQAAEVIFLDWHSSKDQAFALQRPLDVPQRPWLVEELATKPLATAELLENLRERYELSEDKIAHFRQVIGVYGVFSPRVFTPNLKEPTEAHKDWVQFRSCGRLLWSGSVGDLYPGHLLQIDIPAASPSFLTTPAGPGGETWARLLAEFMVTYSRKELDRAREMAVLRVSRESAEPGSLASRIALRTLCKDVILRFRSQDCQSPEFVPLVMKAPEELLSVPLVRTTAGEGITLQELCARLPLWRGLVPFVHKREAWRGPSPPEGMEPLVLDEEQEELLGELLGLSLLDPLDEEEISRERKAQREVVCTDEGSYPLVRVIQMAQKGRSMVMLDGRPGVRTLEESKGNTGSKAPLELKMNPWVALSLREEGIDLRSGFDFPFPAEAPQAYLIQREVDLSFARGIVGILNEPTQSGKVVLLDGQKGVSTAMAMEAGSRLAGALELVQTRDRWRSELFQELHRIEEELWEELLPRIFEDLDVQKGLLAFAGPHLHLYIDEAGLRHFDVSHPIAEAIFEEPLLLCGSFPITLGRLVRDYCLGEGRLDKPWLDLQVELPDHLKQWMAQYLTAAREQKAGRRTQVNADLVGISRLFEVLWPKNLPGPTLQFPFENFRFSEGLSEAPMMGLICREGSLFGYLLLDTQVRVALFGDHPLVKDGIKAGRVTPRSTSLLYGIYEGLRRFYALPLEHEIGFQKNLVKELLHSK